MGMKRDNSANFMPGPNGTLNIHSVVLAIGQLPRLSVRLRQLKVPGTWHASIDAEHLTFAFVLHLMFCHANNQKGMTQSPAVPIHLSSEGKKYLKPKLMAMARWCQSYGTHWHHMPSPPWTMSQDRMPLNGCFGEAKDDRGLLAIDQPVVNCIEDKFQPIGYA